MNANNNNAYEETDIDFYEIIKVIFLNKKSILLFSLIVFIVSAGITFQISNKYMSSALLETKGTSESGLSALGQYSGLASMAGISLPDGEINKTDYTIAKIKSKSFFQDLLQYEDLLQKIYASKSFDSANKSIVYKDRVFKNNKWIKKDGFFIKREQPSYIKAHKVFLKEVLSISKDKETGFINISITHHSPIFAKELLDLIIFETNRIERQKDLENADKSLEFLNIEAQTNTFSVTKDAITNLINEKLNIKMLANTTEDYLLEIIDAPFYPEKKVSPKRLLLSIAITFIFIVIHITYLLIKYFSTKKNSFLASNG